jgi:hypothetical protein
MSQARRLVWSEKSKSAIVDQRGVDPFSPSCAVARLYLARALAMAGDAAGSRGAYEQFLAQWPDADPDVPVPREARKEYARVNSRVVASLAC